MKKKIFSKTVNRRDVENWSLHRREPLHFNQPTITLGNGKPLNDSNDLLSYTCDHKSQDVLRYRSTKKSDLLINFNKLNIKLNQANYPDLRKEALSAIAATGQVLTLKLYGEFSNLKKNKITFICKNVNEGVLAQRLFTVPSSRQLKHFGKEDYTIIVNIDPKYRKHTKNIVHVNLDTQEVLIIGSDSLDQMGPGIFYIINKLMQHHAVN